MAPDMLMSPVRPGEILLAEFLEPLGVSQYQLAKAMEMPTRGDQRHHPWAAPHQRQHGAAARPLFRHVGAILDEPAAPL